MARVSLTQGQLKTDEGQQLLELLMKITHDGVVDYEEVETLSEWLDDHIDSDIPAIGYLRDIIESIWRDNDIDMQDRWDLLLAIERVLPPDQRALAKVRRRDTPEPATQRQIDFLGSLGADFDSELTKRDAMELIDEHKERIASEKEQERSDQKPKKKSKKDEEGLGCGGWITLIILVLIGVGYCNKGT